MLCARDWRRWTRARKQTAVSRGPAPGYSRSLSIPTKTDCLDDHSRQSVFCCAGCPIRLPMSRATLSLNLFRESRAGGGPPPPRHFEQGRARCCDLITEDVLGGIGQRVKLVEFESAFARFACPLFQFLRGRLAGEVSVRDRIVVFAILVLRAVMIRKAGTERILHDH